jgi:hypothetical protein
MKIELESLLERVVAWPDAAQDRLVRAIHEIEVQHNAVPSRGDSRRPAIAGDPTTPSRPGFVVDAETEAFIKRHCFSFF